MSSQEINADSGSALLFELFEEALGLYTHGASYETVLAKCPQQLRDELRQQLDWATRLQATAPAMARPRNQARRAINRKAFINEIHTVKLASNQHVEVETPLFDVLLAYLRAIGQWFEQSFTQSSPRFAPIVAVIAILLFGTVGIGTAAASALPGDAIYPVKEFMRDTRESLASGTNKENIITENENARREENQQAAVKRPRPITVTQELRFYEKGDSIWDIGGQTVLPGYPTTDPSMPDTPMELHGDPKPGDMVRLTYMIIPGKPNMVYGVRLDVLPKEDTPTVEEPATVVVVPTATPTSEPRFCEPNPPIGWVVYRIRKNDTLSGLAIKTGIQVAQIKQVNCRTSDMIPLGGTLYLPAIEGVTFFTENPIVVIPTPTLVPDWGAPASPTPTSAEATVEETPVADLTPTSENTVEPTLEGEQSTATEVPVGATEIVTPAPTAESGTPSETPVVEETATTVPVDEATVTETPAEAPTETVIEVPTATEATDVTPQPTGEFPTVTPTPVAVEPTSSPQEPAVDPTATQLPSNDETGGAPTPMTDAASPTPDGNSEVGSSNAGDANPTPTSGVPVATESPLPSGEPTATSAAPTEGGSEVIDRSGENNPIPDSPAMESPSVEPPPTVTGDVPPSDSATPAPENGDADVGTVAP